ncbi:MAG: tetratricopeptide repeat protein [Ignavibacteriae bacterium]|nr:tetratricopeptide repeat protein [Ignavibacteriota bacterium]
MKIFFLILTVFIVLTFTGVRSRNQQDSINAIQFFVDGKTEELKGNIFTALENYKTALKLHKSPGIYYAISNIYSLQGKMQEALIEINNALKLAPNDIDYLEHKARIYYTMDNLNKAAEIYENILEIDSNFNPGLYSLARIYEELKQPSKAVIIYEKLTNQIGFDMEILRRMYDIYSGFKDYEKCLEVVQYALKLDPYNSTFLQQLGALYVMLKRDNEAKDVFEKYYVLNPENKNIQSELVKLYFKGNETERGFQNFAKLLGKDTLKFEEKVQIGELYFNLISQDASASEITKNIFKNLNEEYPNEWIPYYYLGEMEISVNNISAGVNNLHKALELADTTKDAYLQIGYAYFRIGKNDESFDVLSKGISLYPEDFRMNYFYGLTLQRKGREADAVEYFEKALKISPDELSVMTTLALSFNGLKRYEESDAIYERALKLDPYNVLVLNNYAYNLSERGVNLDKAYAMAKVAIEREPNSASYLDTYGWVCYKMGKYEEAKKYIEKAVTISGSSAVLMEHLGDIYDALKDYKNAKKYWEKALELNPNNQNVKEKLKFVQ